MFSGWGSHNPIYFLDGCITLPVPGHEFPPMYAFISISCNIAGRVDSKDCKFTLYINTKVHKIMSDIFPNLRNTPALIWWCFLDIHSLTWNKHVSGSIMLSYSYWLFCFSKQMERRSSLLFHVNRVGVFNNKVTNDTPTGYWNCMLWICVQNK